MYKQNILSSRFSFIIATLFLPLSLIAQAISLKSSWEIKGNTAKPIVTKNMATGDVNNDGLLDFVAQPNLLHLGNNSTYFSQIANDWAINTTYKNHKRDGYLGDHNGDGKKDVVLIKGNEIVVFHGSNNGLPPNPNQIHTIPLCIDCGELESFDANGDINNDGFDDLIISAPKMKTSNITTGIIYIYYGSSSGINFSKQDSISSLYLSIYFGTQVRYAGDVNKDGFDDFIIGMTTHSGGDNNIPVHIVYGSNTTIRPPTALGLGGFYSEKYADEIGAAGDINGDGFSDFYISWAGKYNGSITSLGLVEIIYGKASGDLYESRKILNPFDFTQDGQFAESVTSAGDFDNDGFSDLAVTLDNKVFIFTGSTQGLSKKPTFEFNTTDKSTIRQAGDIDKDGFSDLLVGEQGYENGVGRVQLLRGRTSMIPNFTVNKRNICIQNPVVSFKDSSIQAISYLWDFGDGTQSIEKNPVKQYTRAGYYTIKLTTKNAKGHSWTTIKDSFIVVRNPIVGGTYSIGEGGNFPDMNMVNIVCECGISGNVNMLFKDGVFAPPALRLENVPTNGFSLTFDSESGNRDNVQLGPISRPPYNWTTTPNIILKNTKNVKFKRLTLLKLRGYGSGSIQIQDAENIRFEECIFPIPYVESSFDTNIIIHNIKNLYFDSCVFDWKYGFAHISKADGVFINKCYGSKIQSDCLMCAESSISIDSSQNIFGSGYSSIDLNIHNSKNIKIEKSIDATLSINNCNKIELTQNKDVFTADITNSSGIKIHKNKHPTKGFYAITGSNGLDTEGYNLIANNFIGFPSNISEFGGGFSIKRCRNFKIYHNTISYESYPGLPCKGVNLQLQNNDSIDVRNNLLIQVKNVECPFIQVDNCQRYTADFNAYCNNRFFNTDVFNSHVLYDFTEFKNETKQDRFSILTSINMNSDLLTPSPETQGLVNKTAPFLTEITEDIDGKPRSQTGVCIGALEVPYPSVRDFSLDTLKTTSLNVGNNTISLSFMNRNALKADSCSFVYQVSGGTIVREKWTGQLPAFSMLNYTFNTPVNILKGRTYVLKVWIENVIEGTRLNDTITQIIGVPMGGTYTLGEDFTDLIDFENNLAQAGTQQDVTLLLKAGNHTFLNDIDWFNPIETWHNQPNWITLKGATNNPNLVRLKCEYLKHPFLRFENLTIETQPLPKIEVTEGAMFNAYKLEINNCIIQSAANNSSKLYSLNLVADSSIIVKNSEFRNLDNALRLYMPKQLSGKNILIENNRFSNIRTAILYDIDNMPFNPPFDIPNQTYYPNLKVVNNTFDTLDRGFYLVYSGNVEGDTNKTVISENKIINCKKIGITSVAVQNALIANNFIQADSLAMDMFTFVRNKVINNSFLGTVQLYEVNNDILNNSFVAQNTPLIISEPFQADTTSKYDFNNYYSLTNKPIQIFEFNGPYVIKELRLEDFRNQYKREQNSISSNPRYKSPTDLHIDSLSPLNGTGGGIFYGVNRDIDEQIRDSTKNDIGADEVNNIAIVMPGDVNFDGIADMQDLLTLGVGIAQQLRGTPRINPSIEWLPQPSTNWQNDILGKNAKHADTNGDGFINSNDTLAISRNYGKRHTQHLRPRNTSPELYLSNLPSSNTEGGWVTANINLGTSALLANDVYGLSFSILLDTSKIKKGSISLNFDTCWIGNVNQRLTMTKEIGIIDVGIVRTNGTNISGNGIIAKIRFQLKEEVMGKAYITLKEGILMNNKGVRNDLNIKTDTFVVKLKSPPLITTFFGSSQTAVVNKRFKSPLKVQVKEASGKPLKNLIIVFTFPTGNTPSATFKNGTKRYETLTDTEGYAISDSLTANGVVGSFYATITLEDGTIHRILLANTNATPISEIGDETISIAPNPFMDDVTISRINGKHKPCIWELFDFQGRLIKKGVFTNDNITLPFSELRPMVYFLKLKIEDTTIVQKVVKF